MTAAPPPGACPDYVALPESVRATTSYEQWLWLSDAEKAGFLQSQTEPDENS